MLENTLENGSYGYVQLLEQIDEEVDRVMGLLGTRNFAATSFYGASLGS
jgi:isopentenyl diphosphate isomerase/L-lactate dehydrogenase-like FMN-dependent dehydrogenase